MIESRQASGKWAFIYLGANVDAFAEAGAMGFAAMNTAGYQNTALGTQAVYDSLSVSTKHMRATGATVAQNLGGDIAEDGSIKRRTQKVPEPTKSTTWTEPKTTTWQPPA